MKRNKTALEESGIRFEAIDMSLDQIVRKLGTLHCCTGSSQKEIEQRSEAVLCILEDVEIIRQESKAIADVVEAAASSARTETRKTKANPRLRVVR